MRSPLTKTWKMKNRVIRDNSNPVYWGIPSKRARRRRMIGSSIVNTASNTGGKIPYSNLGIKIVYIGWNCKQTYRDDTNNLFRKLAYPCEEDCSLANGVDVWDDTDKRDYWGMMSENHHKNDEYKEGRKSWKRWYIPGMNQKMIKAAVAA